VDAAGKPFDPAVHEAISQQESADVPEGQVVQQLRKGYKLRDRLLRPATVIVGAETGSAGLRQILRTWPSVTIRGSWGCPGSGRRGNKKILSENWRSNSIRIKIRETRPAEESFKEIGGGL